MTKVNVSVRPLPHFEGLDLPAYETIGSAGMDVRAAVSPDEPVLLQAGERAMIPTGLSVSLNVRVGRVTFGIGRLLLNIQILCWVRHKRTAAPSCVCWLM